MRRAVELHWPALLAGSACAGLAASNISRVLKKSAPRKFSTETALSFMAALGAAQNKAKYESMPEKDMEKELKRVEKEMLDAARNLEFEKAAQLRDRLAELKEAMFGIALPGEI